VYTQYLHKLKDIENILFYDFQIEIIVAKAQIKYINVRMLSKCVDECGNYKFAICYPRG
jgi:hypothetical protein